MTTSKSVNHFHFGNDVKNLVGNFVYRKFEPFEQVDEQLSKIPAYVKENEDYPVVWDKASPGYSSNVPRYVELKWENDTPVFGGIGPFVQESETIDLIQGQNIFFDSDLQQGFVVYSSKEKEDLQFQNVKISDVIKEKSKLDYLLIQPQENKYTEAIEKDLNEGAAVSAIPVLEPTTNKPIEIVNRFRDKIPAPDILLNAAESPSIVKTSYRSPFSGESLYSSIGATESIAKRIVANTKGEKFNNLFECLELGKTTSQDELLIHAETVPANIQSNFSENFKLVGYAIIKYRSVGDKKAYMYSRFVESTSFRDPYVAYGQTYIYQIRPVYGIYTSSTTRKIFVVASSESIEIDVECTEQKVPEPPRSIEFSYIGLSKIRMSWVKPSSFVKDDGELFEVDDIKGYQIFSRHSLYEPYKLLKYFKFNNTVPAKYRMYAKETIPGVNIVSYEDPNPIRRDRNNAPLYRDPVSWTLEIRPNTDYYFTMCSIDAHGNSSNYGTQYRVRRNNVTGEVKIKIISEAGALKQYPNMLIPNKLVEPVMKVSGYKYLDIFYNPDTNYSTPNTNVSKSSFNLQLFELETQTESNIKIQIDEKEN